MGDGVLVPVELAGHVAAAIKAACRSALLAQRDGQRPDVPVAQLLEVARQLRDLSAGGQEIGQPAAPLSTLDAARRFAVTERTIRRWCASGRLPARRVGRGDWVIETETA